MNQIRKVKNPYTGRMVTVGKLAYKKMAQRRDQEHQEMLDLDKKLTRQNKIDQEKAFLIDQDVKTKKSMKQLKDIQKKFGIEVKNQTYHWQYKILLFKIADGDEKGRFVTFRGLRYRQSTVLVEGFTQRVDRNDYEKYIVRTRERTRWNRVIHGLNQSSIGNYGFREKYAKYTESGQYDMMFILQEYRLKGTPMNKQKANKLMQRRIFMKITNDLENSKMISRFIKYTVDPKAQEFGDLFGVKLSDYVEENQIANSCFLNIIIDTFYNQFEKRDNKGVRMYKELTYKRLCEIIKIDLKESDIGMSIKESHKFFKMFSLGLDVIDVYGSLIHRFRPNGALSKRISPNILRVMIYNNHVYKINKNAQKIGHLKLETESDIHKEIKVSKTYKFRDTKNISKTQVKYVDSMDQITDYIKQNDEKQDIDFIFINVSDLSEVLFEMITKHKVVPNVYYESRITSISFSLDECTYKIFQGTDDTAPEDSLHEIQETEREEYLQQDNEFYKAVMRRDLLSDYPESVLEVDNTYSMAPSSGYMTKQYPDFDDINAIDMRKAYTSCVQKIDKVPVFGYFDVYHPYVEGSEIDPYYMYVVETRIQKLSETLIFDKIFDRVYGFVLLDAKAKGIEFTIKYVRKYSKLEPVNFKKAVSDLYESDIHEDSKKYIVNKTTGLLEKKFNRKGVTKIFNTYEEAQMYQIKYSDKFKSKIVVLSGDVNEMHHSPMYVQPVPRKVTKFIFLLYIYAEERMNEGLRQIKELIYCMMKIKLHNLYTECKKEGLKVVGVKTDSVLVRNTKKEIVKTSLKFENKIGGLKIDLLKECANAKIQPLINSLIQIKKYPVKVLKVNDEYDQSEFNEIFENTNRILIKSSLPGCGKTESVKRFSKNTLFVCPFNELALELKKEGYHSVTAHSLLKICGFAGKNEELKEKAYDVSKYDTICFDEIFLHNSFILKKIDQWIDKHPEIRFIATGDLLQNDPIGDPNENTNYNSIINMVFPNQITLTVNKRLTDDGQKAKLLAIKRDLFNVEIPVMETVRKHFKIVKSLSQVKTKINISYSNHMANKINKHIHRLQKDEIGKKTVKVLDYVNYYEGLTLICKKRIWTKDIRTYTNYIYRIEKVTPRFIEILEEFDDVRFKIPAKMIPIHFKLPYCRTGHSLQGKTVKDKVTIFEVDSPYVNRKWVWTALTRCRNFDDVQIYETPEDEIEMLNHLKLKQYLNLKIAGYKSQDKKSGREIDDDSYVNVDWFYEKLDKSNCTCAFCKKPFEKISETGSWNITADRMDNSQAHHMDNCILSCVQCNCHRSNKNNLIFA